MGRLTTVCMLGLFALAGCVNLTASNELAQVGGGRAVPPSAGVILFGHARAPVEPPIFWSIEMNRLTPGSRRLEPPFAGAGGANHVKFRHFGGMLARDHDYAAFSVVPGEYAVTRIVPTQEGALYIDPKFEESAGQAASMGLAGLAGMVILGTAAAAERSAERARFGERGRSPLVYLTGGGDLAPEAPHFTVRPGEVVYLGDFLFGARRYFDERPDIGAGAGAKWTRVFASPFVEHTIDEARARNDLEALGLGGRPMRPAQPGALAAGRTYFAPYLTRDRVDWLSAGTVVGEDEVQATPRGRHAVRQEQASPARQVAPTPAPGELAGVGDAELRRRFLAGEISVSQYRAAVAARR